MIAKLKNDKNQITIPGFYDNVDILSENERSEINSAPFSEIDYKKALDLKDIHGEADIPQWSEQVLDQLLM